MTDGDEDPDPPRRGASSRALGWLAVAYPLSTIASLLLKPAVSIPSAVYPPVALELAALMVLPRSRWPWIALFATSCDLLVMPAVTHAIAASAPAPWYFLLLSLVTTLVALGMAVALRLGRVAQTAPTLLWILPLGALPGALMTTWLHAALAHQSLLPFELVIRCLSSTLTVVTLCPLVLGLLQGFDEPIRPLAGSRERFGIGAAFAAVCLLCVFIPWHVDRFLELMLFAGPLLWLSLRGSHRAVTLACAAIAIGVGVACSHGIGRFPPLVTLGTWRDGILSVQAFLLITCTEALFINRIVLSQRALLQDSRHKQTLLAAYGKALDDAEESTRRAAARDLHDGVAQIIAGQSMILGVLRRRMQESHLHELLDEAIAACREAQSAVRATIEDLSPPEVDRATLGEILTGLAGHFSRRYRFQVHWRITGEQYFDFRHSRLLHKAIRELIYNAFKHAEVKSVRVELFSDETGTLVSVIDAGVGFDPGRPAEDGRQRHGLTHLAERIAGVQGRLDIHAAPGLGCTVTLFLPALPPATPAVAIRNRATAAAGARD